MNKHLIFPEPQGLTSVYDVSDGVYVGLAGLFLLTQQLARPRMDFNGHSTAVQP